MTATPVHLGSQALQALHVSLTQLRASRSSYDALAARLATLTDEPRHAAQIPLGPLASMAGQLINTNTVLVELGEYHVEYSAKQARAVALRRKKALDDQISALEEQAETLEKSIAEEAHLDRDLHVNEAGDLLNEEGLPIMDIVEPEQPSAPNPASAAPPLKSEPAPSAHSKRHVDWRKLADELEEEDEVWLAKHAEESEQSMPASTQPAASQAMVSPASISSVPAADDPPKRPAMPERPVSALKDHRRPSISKKVHFGAELPDVEPEPTTPGPAKGSREGIRTIIPLLEPVQERPIKEAVIERPSQGSSAERPPNVSRRSSDGAVDPAKNDVAEVALLSEKAKGKQRAAHDEEAPRPILGGVTEKPVSSKPAVAPDQALRDWMRLKTPEELAQVDSDEDEDYPSDSDESSNYHYDDDEELQAAIEEMDQMMLAREAALAYHRERPDQAKAQATERDEDLDDDEFVDEEGNLRYVNLGNQSRFRGGANQTASLIIPALSVARESEEPSTEGDELDFFADAALTPEDRAVVRARLQALRDGNEEKIEHSTGTVSAEREDERPSLVDTVTERAPHPAGGVAEADGTISAPSVSADDVVPPKKVSRFRARQAA